MGMLDSLQFRVGLDMRPAELALIGFRSRMSTLATGLAGLKGAALGIGATLGGGLAAGAAALDQVLSAGSEMEAFESRLTTLMGSSSQARARLGELFDFAAKTPFEVGEIVAAETTLRGFGAAAEELLPGLIDFAATTGAEMSQAAIDFGKAWSVGATGLESDFGKILRKQIELRAGLNATDMSLEQFRATMLETLDEGMFAGGAARLSTTFSGMVSNLKDEWSRFKLEVADAGVFNSVKAALSATLGLISQNREEIKVLAGIVSDALWGGFRLVVTGAGVLVDTIEAMAFTLSTKVIPLVMDMVGLVVDATSGFREMLAIQLEFAGDTRAADQVRNLGTAARASLAGMVAENALFAAGLDNTNDKTLAAVGLLNAAEESAKGFGEAMAEAGGGPTTAAKGGGDGGGDKAADTRLKELDAAFAFADEMRALRADAAEQETLDLQMEYGQRLAELQAYHDDALISGQLYYDTLGAIETDFRDRMAQLRQADAEKERAMHRDTAFIWADTVLSVLGAIEGMLDTSNAKQKAAAKALAGSQIAISGIVAQARAWEAGWPAGLPLSIAAAAETAAQVAALASAHQGAIFHQRHQGGPAPDEVDVRALRGEAVLNRQAVRRIGEQGVNELNGGGMMGPPDVVVRIGRASTREMQREEVRSGGPMTRHINERVGIALNGDRDTGFSGRQAFA